MKATLNFIFLSIFLSLSAISSGTPQFLIQDVLIEDVAVFWRDGYTVLQLKLSEVNISTGCAPTDQHLVVSDWTSGNFSNNWSFRLALIMSAHAQQLPVDIQITDYCNTDSRWTDLGTPNGLGRELEGVRVHQPL